MGGVSHDGVIHRRGVEEGTSHGLTVASEDWLSVGMYADRASRFIVIHAGRRNFAEVLTPQVVVCDCSTKTEQLVLVGYKLWSNQELLPWCPMSTRICRDQIFFAN